MKTKFYGLTGGIGSGKSTVAQMLAELDVPILDLDKVGKLLLDDKTIQSQLIATFGKTILTNDKVDRLKLRDTAFSSQDNTNQLNQIMHPAIREYERKWRSEQTASFAIIEASVLIESGAVERMDGVIVVFADEKIREQRVISRGDHDKQAFGVITQRQCDDKLRKEVAGFRINNNTNLESLHMKVLTLYQQLNA